MPGVYGPNCTQHVGITNNQFFLQTTVEDTNGEALTFAAALGRWSAGEDVEAIDSPITAERNSVCADPTDDRS